MAGAANNGGEDSSGSIISCKASFAHAGAIVNNKSSNVFVTHLDLWFCTGLGLISFCKVLTDVSPFYKREHLMSSACAFTLFGHIGKTSTSVTCVVMGASESSFLELQVMQQTQYTCPNLDMKVVVMTCAPNMGCL